MEATSATAPFMMFHNRKEGEKTNLNRTELSKEKKWGESVATKKATAFEYQHCWNEETYWLYVSSTGAPELRPRALSVV
jgi:hypothetical protein